MKRAGKRTIIFDNKPSIAGYAAVVGKLEGEGPIAAEFDKIIEDTTCYESCWERAESDLQKYSFLSALDKSNLTINDIDIVFAGDLINQCMASYNNFKEFDLPVIGIYGACTTMAEGLGLAGVFVDSEAANYALAITSSHYSTSERQFRMPLEYGSVKPPSAQHTVTGSGAAIVGKNSGEIFLKAFTPGSVVDYNVKDSANMGAAMAPAAYKTIKSFFEDTNLSPKDFDLILTGDLGDVGAKLCFELVSRELDIPAERYNDCGQIIYNREKQNVYSGGSGCGCSAAVICSYIFNRIKTGAINNMLFIGTGALLNSISTQQGENVTGIAHLVWISGKHSIQGEN